MNVMHENLLGGGDSALQTLSETVISEANDQKTNNDTTVKSV